MRLEITADKHIGMNDEPDTKATIIYEDGTTELYATISYEPHAQKGSYFKITFSTGKYFFLATKSKCIEIAKTSFEYNMYLPPVRP